MSKILNYIVACIRLILVMISMVIYYIWFELLRPFKRDKYDWGMQMQKAYTRICLWLFSTKYSVSGNPISKPALYVCNHRSLLDPVVLKRYINALGVAKIEIASYPILGRAAARTGVVYVDRENKKSRASVKDTIVETLKKDRSIFIYPEGGVSDEKTTLPFKKGSFEKAVEAGVPVVPVTIIFDDPIYHWVNIGTVEYYFNSFGWKTPNVHMIIDDPIYSSNVIELLNKTQEKINSNLLKNDITNFQKHSVVQ